LVGGTVVGNPAVRVTGICGIREAGPGQLTFMADARYAHLLKSTRASAVITSRDVRSAPIPMIQTKNPSLAFAKLASYVYPERERHFEGVHPKAWIAKTARLGKGVSVHAFAVVDEAARIGDRTVICPGCYVGRTARIGNDCVIYPNVSIRERVEIGHRVIIHSGTVVGSDGFGFATVKGIHHKIPQIGTVVIEDDVELGANVTIDRARFGKTVIGRGTKLDNLVQVAHNVEIGPNCIMVAQSGISGSTRLGSHVVLAGQVGVVGHITLGDNVMVGAQSGVTKSIPGNTQVWGYPAKPLARAKRINAAVQRLPELHQRVDALRKQLASLEKRIEGRND
jgi:UDP-3-O-[3-hydroxymyristoyl] glucosamine N-acyltransferase